MSKSRIELQSALEEVLGSRNVYFQPPESIKLQYPCIIYNISDVDVMSANNKNYVKNIRYFLTVIDKRPDSDIYDRILDSFEMSALDRVAVVQNLNHWYMTIYW